MTDWTEYGITKPYYSDDAICIVHADCRDVLPLIPDKNIDLVLTDPPYELGFMGKKWDKTGIAFNLELWKECLRVIKPGGNLLSFGGTRTYHRMVCAIEDAGFEIRDCIMWVYGSGFPKSLDISKAIDKEKGTYIKGNKSPNSRQSGESPSGCYGEGVQQKTLPNAQSTEAKLWEGYGTGLKPAYEPIVLAMSPLDGTFAENCLKWGVGAEEISVHNAPRGTFAGGEPNRGSDTESYRNHQGRFPANFIHDGSQEVMELFPRKSGAHSVGKLKRDYVYPIIGQVLSDNPFDYGDSGSAARFFYTPKASRSERNSGTGSNTYNRKCLKCGKWQRRQGFTDDYTCHCEYPEWEKPTGNSHPTVKPLALMEYLVKLVTRPGHLILDPFLGSGTTLVCARKLGRKAIGIEIEQRYCQIAVERLRQSVMKLETMTDWQETHEKAD